MKFDLPLDSAPSNITNEHIIHCQYIKLGNLLPRDSENDVNFNVPVRVDQPIV